MDESQSWKSEFQLAFKNIRELYAFLDWECPEELISVSRTYPLFVPRNLARMIRDLGPESPLAKEFLPQIQEADHGGLEDPIGDKEFLKAPQLIHRYKTRALFTPTNVCPVHCRYCFRKNELSATENLFQKDFQATLSYLSSHPEISELIFTGGDPLTLSDEKLESYLTSFSEVASLKDIRFHTRYPVILPERLNDSFVKTLKKFTYRFRTITLVVHVNHKSEFTEEARVRIMALGAAGIQVLSQTVLLKGVNDNKEALVELVQNLLELRVRPYYLHHPDRVKGGMHFYLPLEAGRKLYAELKRELPGWAVPHYVIDIPGGHGKTSAYNPESLQYSGKLLSKDGELITAPEQFLH